MNESEFKRINELINDTILNMTPAQRTYHEINVGIQFRNLLCDYNWDRRVFDIPVEQMKTLQVAEYNQDNFEYRIPIWMDKWDNFSYSAANPVERETFEKEATQIRYLMAHFMGDHPVNRRILRWVMQIFNEEKRCFHYDKMQ